jgi:hypothetical protein
MDVGENILVYYKDLVSELSRIDIINPAYMKICMVVLIKLITLLLAISSKFVILKIELCHFRIVAGPK